jgi:hypothetical protein
MKEPTPVPQGQLEAEIDDADKARSFLIWKMVSNAQFRRETPTERLIVQYLDHVHSNISTVTRYQNKGFQLVHSHFVYSTKDTDGESNARLQEIENFVSGQQRLRDQVRAEVIKEFGMQDKIKAAAERLKEK